MVSVKRKKIACLPVAGLDNPYQHLMMEGLNESGRLWAFNGVDDKFGGILRTVLKHRPGYLHFDWIVSYYYRRWRWLTYLSVPLFCLQILIVKYLFRVKLVWTLHNILPHDLDLVPVHRFCQRFLARHCKWIRVFSSTSVAKAAQELQVPSTTFRVIPEGDYTTYYPNTVTREEARRYLNLPAEAKVLLYLGLIKPYKGILELVRLFKAIAPEAADARLIIAGRIKDRAYGEQIKQEMEDTILLIDRFIPQNELQYFYNAADVVVLPFITIENSGSAIMAMGFLKPIIAPAQGVLTERLAQQKELLYQDQTELRARLVACLRAKTADLQALGAQNGHALKYQWKDLSTLFV